MREAALCRRRRHFCLRLLGSHRLLGGLRGRWQSLVWPSGSSTLLAQVRLHLPCVCMPSRRDVVVDVLMIADSKHGAAGFVVTALPQLFTKSAAVVALMANLAPIMAASITVHTASMATEGMLLAGRDLGFLVRSYAVNATLVVLGLKATQALSGTSSVVYVWFGVLQFQTVRLVLNLLRLMSRNSCLNAKEVLTAA